MKMELRKEIESLAVWFIVASAIALALNLSATVSGTSNLENMFNALSSPSAFVAFFSAFGLFIKLIDNLAVSMWLFRRTSLCGYNRWLWAIFGLAGSLVGGALYLLIRVHESKSSNKALNSPSAGTAKSAAR
jgi:hypothetical protein